MFQFLHAFCERSFHLTCVVLDREPNFSVSQFQPINSQLDCCV